MKIPHLLIFSLIIAEVREKVKKKRVKNWLRYS